MQVKWKSERVPDKTALHVLLLFFLSLYCKDPAQTITKTCLFKYTENFTTKKWKFTDKKFWYFFIFLPKT